MDRFSSRSKWLFLRLTLMLIMMPILLIGYRSSSDSLVARDLYFSAKQSALMLRLIGFDAIVSSDSKTLPVLLLVRLEPDKVSIFDVVPDCGVAKGFCLLFLAILVFPATWRARVLGWVSGFVVLQVANIFRLIVLSVVNLCWGSEALDFWHHYVMQAFYLGVIFFFFMIWLHLTNLKSKSS